MYTFRHLYWEGFEIASGRRWSRNFLAGFQELEEPDWHIRSEEFESFQSVLVWENDPTYLHFNFSTGWPSHCFEGFYYVERFLLVEKVSFELLSDIQCDWAIKLKARYVEVLYLTIHRILNFRNKRCCKTKHTFWPIPCGRELIPLLWWMASNSHKIADNVVEGGDVCVLIVSHNICSSLNLRGCRYTPMHLVNSIVYFFKFDQLYFFGLSQSFNRCTFQVC